MLASVVEHDNVVSSLSVSRDGTRALTGSLDRRLVLIIFFASMSTLTRIYTIPQFEGVAHRLPCVQSHLPAGPR